MGYESATRATTFAELPEPLLTGAEDRLAAMRRGDVGVSINGFPSSEGACASYWVSLGAPDGEDARSALDTAIRAAKV